MWLLYIAFREAPRRQTQGDASGSDGRHYGQRTRV